MSLILLGKNLLSKRIMKINSSKNFDLVIDFLKDKKFASFYNLSATEVPYSDLFLYKDRCGVLSTSKAVLFYITWLCYYVIFPLIVTTPSWYLSSP